MTPPSILIVDDDPDICTAMSDLLLHEGYQVETAGTGTQAINHVQHRPYQAVLLDIGLPDLDGLSVLKALLGHAPTLPVIVLTAFGRSENAVMALNRGAFAYITKPYNRDELKATIRRALGVHSLTMKVERAQTALQDSEGRFRSIVESTPDAIVLADQHGVVVFWNRAACELFGYAQEDMVGTPLTTIMPTRYRQRFVERLEMIRQSGQLPTAGKRVELHGLRKNGVEFPLEVSLGTWTTQAGIFFSGIIRDISERKEAEETMARLRHQQELILTGAGEGIYGLDRHGRTMFVNPAGAAMLGYDVDELLDRPMHQILHHTKLNGEPYPESECPIYAALHDGAVHRVTDEIFWRKDGTHLPVEYVSTPIREQAAPIGAVVVFRDISERKRAEADLRASMERFDLAVRGSRDGIWDAWVVADDPFNPCNAIFYSKRFKELLGFDDQEFEDVIGSWSSRLHPDDRDRVFEALRAHLEQRVPYDIEYRMFTKSNECRWFAARGDALWNERGSPVRMSGSFSDITLRKQAEEGLREGQERFRQLTENIREVFWLSDPDKMQMLYVSPAYEDIWGRSCQSLYVSPRSWLDAIYPEDRSRVRDAAMTKQSSGAYDEEYRIVRPDDTVRWIRDRAFPIKDHAGKVYRIAGIAEDITDRKVAT
jgi:PAS domain S-box-containing protein